MVVLRVTHKRETVFVVLDMQAHNVINVPRGIMDIPIALRVPVVFPEH